MDKLTQKEIANLKAWSAIIDVVRPVVVVFGYAWKIILFIAKHWAVFVVMLVVWNVIIRYGWKSWDKLYILIIGGTT